MGQTPSDLQLAAVVEDFRSGSPSQELLDRFLTGLAPWGEVARPMRGGVIVHSRDGSGADDLARRAADFGVASAKKLAEAVSFARAILFVPRDAGARPPDSGALEELLGAAPRGARVFVAGRLGRDAASARRAIDLARSRGLAIAAGGYMPFTWRLPAVDVPFGARLTHALVAPVGDPGAAEYHGLEALLALTARREGGERGVAAVTARAGAFVWQMVERDAQLRRLFEAAVSRSDSPQGDALTDGRTQDIVGLGIVPKLARDPIAWEIEHADGLRSALVVLNGVVADSNFAVRESSGRITSAQLYLPPAPGRHYWTALARRAHSFLAGGPPPWPAERTVLLDGLLAALEAARASPGERAPAKDLAIAYAAAPESQFER